MKRIAALALLLTLMVACGGGGAPAPRIVAFYGDSLTSGYIEVSPGTLQVPPVRRIEELASHAFLAIDYSRNGARARDYLSGVGMPVEAFAVHVTRTPAQTVVIRLGGADALLGTALDDFIVDLEQLVHLTRQAGKTPVLVGLIQTHLSRVAEFDAAVRQVAQAQAVQFIDTRAVVFMGPQEFVDGIHPGQAYADRMAALIAQELAW